MLANLGRCALFWYLIHSVWSQGFALLMFSSNPVYSGEPVTLTFTYGSGAEVLYGVTVDAFSGTVNKGRLYCTPVPIRTTSVGVFAGALFAGCPTVAENATNVNLTLNATSSLELDYNCTAKVDVDGIVTKVPCGTGSLVVNVLPELPKFIPHSLSLTNNQELQCESLKGKPAAVVRLTVTSTKGAELTSTAAESTALLLPPPLMNWHGATAVCTVLNHKFPNMTTTSSITVQPANQHKFAAERGDAAMSFWLALLALTLLTYNLRPRPSET